MAVAQKGSDPSINPPETEVRRGKNKDWFSVTLLLQASGKPWEMHSTLRQWDRDINSLMLVDGSSEAAKQYCPLCSIFSSGDCQLMFTSLLGFKVNFLKIFFLICRETEKHECKNLKNEETNEKISPCFPHYCGFRELMLQGMGRMQAHPCTSTEHRAGGQQKTSCPAERQKDVKAWPVLTEGIFSQGVETSQDEESLTTVVALHHSTCRVPGCSPMKHSSHESLDCVTTPAENSRLVKHYCPAAGTFGLKCRIWANNLQGSFICHF